MKKLCNTKTLSGIILLALLISVVPILIASFYSRPAFDDFGYSSAVHNAVNNGGNILDIISAAINQVKSTYFAWQGSFSAIFIFSLQPAAFSDKLYFLTTFILIGAFIFSNIFFVQTVVTKLLKNKKEYGFIISGSILFMSIQFVNDKAEAFYWWNGASYYSLFYSFALIFFACIIRLYLSDKDSKKILFFIISLALSFIIGGGNFTTALTTSVIMFLVEIYVIKSRAKKGCFYHMIFLVLLVSFLINMLAPGNSARAGELKGMSAIEAVFYSLFYSLTGIFGWIRLPQIALFIFLTPLLYKMAKSIKYDFKYPFIVVAVSFLVFATQLTPPLFAMSSIGSGRQINIYYYFCYLMTAFDIFYVCGWISKKSIAAIKINTHYFNKIILSVALSLLIIFAVGCVQYGVKSITSVDTALSLINGTAKTYDAQYNERTDKIKSGEKEIEEIDCVPDFFKPLGIEEDPDYWVNRQISGYYGVDSITLKTD